MKKLSEYKEFFYRDRSLEELFNEEIWYKIYELVYEKHFFGGYCHLPEEKIVTIFNSVYTRYVCWNSDLLANKREIDAEMDRLDEKSRVYNLDNSSALFEIACIYSVYLLHIKQLPKIPWRFDLVRRRIERDFDLVMELNLQDIQKIEGTYPLDLTPHPNFEALEQRTADWWNEATDYFRQERIRTLSRLYEVPEENLRMERLVRKMYNEAPARPGSDGKFLAFRDENTGWTPYLRWERVEEEAVQAEEAEEVEEKAEENAPQEKIQYGLKEGRLTDFVKVVSAMYDLDMFYALDGRKPSKKALIVALGKFLGEEVKNPLQLLGSAKNNDNYLKVFDDLRERAEKYYSRENETKKKSVKSR